MEVASSERQPSRWEACWFGFRSRCFKFQRWLRNWVRGDVRRLRTGVGIGEWEPVATHVSPLFSSSEVSEFTLQAGKVHNLRLAAKGLNGVKVKAGQVWSFWAQVGRPVKSRGYVYGREVREGCVIPAVGGGLCQMSGAIYQGALDAGLEIVERHAHTRRVARSGMVPGRDATVFWNYVDLRLRAPFDWQMEVRLENGQLVVKIYCERGMGAAGKGGMTRVKADDDDHTAESCESCGMVSCFRHAEMAGLKTQARTAFLVDEWWPEFDAWIGQERGDRDRLLMPMKPGMVGGKRYPWSVKGWERVSDFPAFVVGRSWRSRRLAGQGAERQRSLLKSSCELASLYEKHLPFDALHVVVTQSLLPYLWLSGALGGRTFDVLMQRAPLGALQESLDRAYARHPESSTLGDFRLDGDLVMAEEEALKRANRWITPNRQLAEMAGSRAVLLDWTMPQGKASEAKKTFSKQMVFPASTLGRKGAYEVRETARTLGWTVVLSGPVLESAEFWRGVEVVNSGADWLNFAGPVVMPVWAESQPRRLLLALANGRPVITTKASGLEGLPGVIVIEEGAAGALIEALGSVGMKGGCA